MKCLSIMIMSKELYFTEITILSLLITLDKLGDLITPRRVCASGVKQSVLSICRRCCHKQIANGRFRGCNNF